MAPKYWGDLPEPTVHRDQKIPLSVDTKADRHNSTQSQSRQNRFSTQTDQTISTQSPFASPVASSFRPDGLTPRPPSFPYPPDPVYNSDYLEKRKRRESRNKEPLYDNNGTGPALNESRAPPLSYKQPYGNGTSSSNTQALGYSRSTRRSNGPVSPNKPQQDDTFPSQPKYTYPPIDDQPLNFRKGTLDRSSSARGAARIRGSELLDLSDSQPRKGSLSEMEAKKLREWAPDRSPLQRLELTLDSITKEEKRARVEEAELVAREAKSGRGGERATQNSVRFRNRPVAKANSETVPQSEPQNLLEAGMARNISRSQKQQLQRSGTIEKKQPEEFSPVMSGGRGFDYEPEPEPDNPDNTMRLENSSKPQRGASVKSKSDAPSGADITAAAVAAVAAAGLTRTTSNRLKKEPPGNPWFNRRVEAERQYPEVIVSRQPSVNKRQVTTSANAPNRGTAFGSHPQSPKESLILPREDQPTSQYPINGPDSDSENGVAAAIPMRRGSARKIEQLTGQKAPKELHTQNAVSNENKYAAPPSGDRLTEIENSSHKVQPGGHHHIRDIFHPSHHINEDGLYTPGQRLDEWRKGGVALLSEALLDLEINEKTESDKDKAWWEAGNTGKRRSSFSQRRGAAYDGEYDDDNARVRPRPTNPSYQRIKDAKNALAAAPQTPSPSDTEKFISSPHFHTVHVHSLTYPMRSIRVRFNIAPTRFKPPLFLKCGPLLRYCGMRRERLQGRTKPGPPPQREIWRGSVMIVTEDANSSYELAPTLRLFLQPTNLLPPPPAQVDGEGLASEYVDPIAGLPKIGRDGRTLYIRPVEDLEQEVDLSIDEDGLFEAQRSTVDGSNDANRKTGKGNLRSQYDGEKAGKYKEVRGFRLHTEQGVTFWRFNIEVELRSTQQRIAYRINRGPATGFWVPAREDAMNIMFHSCNGFSLGVDPDEFSGPDPMWRDVLNTHQTQPFHVMLGGGDQLYNDAVMDRSELFKDWLDIKNPLRKEALPFTADMQREMEEFYLDNYCTWYSQGLFSLAASQIPMVNILDDHDIIDGFGSYGDAYMRCPVMSGLGNVAFKYYMLFQHQSSIDEGEETESSWILGTQPGPYITELSRSIFTNLGRSIAFLGIDCRTERMYDEIVTAETYSKIFDRLESHVIKGETKHLIVMLGVPIAYPRLVWLETLLTSRIMTPVKILGRTGLLGKNLMNQFDGGVEILDDLDDHWTAAHHKDERNWLIQELQDLAAEKSVRVTILGGDVHLGAIGQFYSNPKLGIPKDRDHRYMANVISSAIVNAPPPDVLADVLNKRNKVHHLDSETDEDMIPIFTHDVGGKPRHNKRLLNRRNWCSIRQYNPALNPPPPPILQPYDGTPSPPPQRKRSLLRRLSTSRGASFRSDGAPPLSNAGFFSRTLSRRASTDSQRPGSLTRTLSLSRKDFVPDIFRRNSKRRPDDGGINGYGADSDDDIVHNQNNSETMGMRGGAGSEGNESDDYLAFGNPPGRPAKHPIAQASTSVAGGNPQAGYYRQPTNGRKGTGANQEVDLEGGLDICLNIEVNHKDPAGITMPYRLLVPALWYEDEQDEEELRHKREFDLVKWMRKKGNRKRGVDREYD